MEYRLLLKEKAKRGFAKLPEKDKIRVRKALQAIKIDFLSGKPLHGEWRGHFSYRVWPYRILYTIEKRDLVIIVIDIDHRGRVY